MLRITEKYHKREGLIVHIAYIVVDYMGLPISQESIKCTYYCFAHLGK